MNMSSDEHSCVHVSGILLGLGYVLILPGYCQIALFICIFIGGMFTEHLLCAKPQYESRAEGAIALKMRSRGKGVS